MVELTRALIVLREIGERTSNSKTKGMTAVEAGRLIERVHLMAASTYEAGKSEILDQESD